MYKQLRITKGSLSSKTFLSIVAISSAALLLITSVWFFMFRIESSQYYQELTEQSIANTEQVFAQHIKAMRSWASEWFSSVDGTCARLQDGYKQIESMRFYKSIHDVMNMNGYMQSVYIIDKQYDVSFYAGGGVSHTEALNNAIRDIFKADTLHTSPFFWTVKNRYQTKDDVPLLSVYTTERSQQSQFFLGAIVLNADARALSKAVFTSTQDYATQLMIVDRNGRIVLCSDADAVGSVFSHMERIATTSMGNYHFDAEDAGGRYSYTVLRSSLNGFSVIARAPIFTAVGAYGGTLLVVLAALAVALLLVICAAMITMRHVYAPLRKIVTDMHAYIPSGENTREDANELRVLQTFKNHMDDRVRAMDEQIRDLMTRVEDASVVTHILGGGDDEKTRNLLMQRYAIDSDAPFRLVALRIQLPTDSFSHDSMRDYDRIRTEVQEAFTEALSTCARVSSYSLGLNQLLFVLASRDCVTTNTDSLLASLNSARETFEKSRGIHIFATLSPLTHAFSDTFRAMNGALRVRELADCEPIGTYLPDDARLKPLCTSLADALHARNNEVYNQCISEALNVLCDCEYSVFERFLKQTAVTAAEIREKTAPTAIDAEDELIEVLRAISQIDTHEKLMLWFDALFNRVKENLNRIAQHTTVSQMKDAVDYIRSHYTDPMLGAASLSARFGISAAYFGKLFRAFAGTSLTDYISCLRLENAYALLSRQPQANIAEIAEAVGFSSATYFTTQFKKHYGFSPSQLRDYISFASEQDGR